MKTNWKSKATEVLELIKLKRKPKKPKPVKKNTMYRRFRAWMLKLDHRQQQDSPKIVLAQDTQHVCKHCGTQFEGAYCPKCGLPARWHRFTWKQMILSFLDIWGLGNRPMFKTIRDLFWRPGYMVRDYLRGHHLSYFPPFKLLAVSVIMLIFVSFLMTKLLQAVFGPSVDLYGIQSSSMLAPLADFLEGKELSGSFSVLCDAAIWFIHFLSQNLLYEWLFLAICAVICIWIGFRQVSRYNFVETYIFLIFGFSQGLLCRIFEIIGTATGRLLEMPAATDSVIQTPSFIHIAATSLSFIGSLVSYAFYVWTNYLFLALFKQFYDLKWKSTIKYLALSFLVAGWFILLGFFAFLFFVDQFDEHHAAYGIVFLITLLLPMAFFFANDYLIKNKMQITPAVSRMCKASLLSVFVAFMGSMRMYMASYSVMSIITSTIAYYLCTVGLSLLPVVLYKKYHRNWIAFLPLLLVVALTIVCIHFISGLPKINTPLTME